MELSGQDEESKFFIHMSEIELLLNAIGYKLLVYYYFGKGKRTHMVALEKS